MTTGRSSAWAGWIAFAGSMLLVISTINIFQGLVALFDDERVVAVADRFVLVDITSWGWTLLLAGVLMFCIGIGLLLGMGWARVAGIVVVGLHAVAQVAWLGAYPIWAVLMIAMDTFVLFALTARWSEARGDLRSYGERAGSADAIPGDRSFGDLPQETAGYPPRVT